jgi:hypothetical protein
MEIREKASGLIMINSGERGFGLAKFSLAERDRRWARVQQLMRREKLDALIGFPNQSHWDQFQADIRYLTHIGGHQTEAAVVFPQSGQVTAFVRGSNEIEWWQIAQDWVTDIRPSRREWSPPLIARMKELKLDHGRIGVSGLSGLLRAPEGTVVSGMLESVRRAFPNAQFENATELLQEARSIKSAEEIAWMERAAEILDKVVAAILAKAQPGVMENEMVATIWHTIIANGGDYPSMTHWGAGAGVPWACRIAPHRPRYRASPGRPYRRFTVAAPRGALNGKSNGRRTHGMRKSSESLATASSTAGHRCVCLCVSRCVGIRPAR